MRAAVLKSTDGCWVTVTLPTSAHEQLATADVRKPVASSGLPRSVPVLFCSSEASAALSTTTRIVRSTEPASTVAQAREGCTFSENAVKSLTIWSTAGVNASSSASTSTTAVTVSSMVVVPPGECGGGDGGGGEGGGDGGGDDGSGGEGGGGGGGETGGGKGRGEDGGSKNAHVTSSPSSARSEV